MNKNYKVSEGTAALMEMLNTADCLQSSVLESLSDVLGADEYKDEFLERYGKMRETLVKIVKESVSNELENLKPNQL